MKIIVQRVLKASVTIENKVHSSIENGILALVGISEEDNNETIDWVANKLVNLRIFNDENSKMNLSLKDVDGELLLIPNFTLYGELKKGFRPNFMASAKPEISKPIFNKTIENLKIKLPNKVESGIFGADMKVELINDGPVTVIIEKWIKNIY